MVHVKRTFLALAALLIAASPMTSGAASIIYDVNRTIGAGTVSGFVQTDGTQGVLSGTNITDWTLTLAAPNLRGGSPSVISFGSALTTFLSGSATTATLSQLLFDFSIPDSIFLLQGSNTNFWCLETANLNCTGAGAGEHMGQNAQGGLVAQTALYSGPVVLGTVSSPPPVSPVPEPEIYAMMGLGLGLLAWIGRRKKLSQTAAAA